MRRIEQRGLGKNTVFFPQKYQVDLIYFLGLAHYAIFIHGAKNQKSKEC